jgi:hypothetical protein
LHQFVLGILENEHDRSLVGLLLAVVVLLHLAIFPGYIASKRRHPRARMISLASFSIIPLGVGLWLAETDWTTMGMLLALWFLYFLVWAYRSKRAADAEERQAVAERLTSMRQSPPVPPKSTPALSAVDYEIVGMDRKTGKPAKVVIRAASSADAKSEAADRGIVITDIRQLTQAPT